MKQLLTLITITISLAGSAISAQTKQATKQELNFPQTIGDGYFKEKTSYEKWMTYVKKENNKITSTVRVSVLEKENDGLDSEQNEFDELLEELKQEGYLKDGKWYTKLEYSEKTGVGNKSFVNKTYEISVLGRGFKSEELLEETIQGIVKSILKTK